MAKSKSNNGTATRSARPARHVATRTAARRGGPDGNGREATAEQVPKGRLGTINGLMRDLTTFGGSAGPGFGEFKPPAPGTFDTYRDIERDPTVFLAMGKMIGEIAGNWWTWKKREDSLPDDPLDELKNWFDPRRELMVLDGMMALRRGFAPFEEIWQVVEETGHVMPELKPLRVDYTTFLKAKNASVAGGSIVSQARGGIVGLRNQPPGGEPVDLGPMQSFAFTFGGEAGDPYGVPLLENLRKIWPEAEQIRCKIATYVGKISGVIGQIHYPDGTSKDAGGADRPNAWLAKAIADAAAQGKWLLFQNAFASFTTDGEEATPAIVEKALAAAGKSQWVVSFVDPGGADHGPGFVALLQYYDALKCRGVWQPERAILEGKHGTKAESGVQGQISTMLAGMVDRSFAKAFNRGVLDDVVVANWGLPRGSYYVEPAPLADEEYMGKLELAKAALASPTLGDPVGEKIVWDHLLEDLGCKVEEERKGAVIASLPPMPPSPEPYPPADGKDAKEKGQEQDDEKDDENKPKPGKGK